MAARAIEKGDMSLQAAAPAFFTLCSTPSVPRRFLSVAKKVDTPLKHAFVGWPVSWNEICCRNACNAPSKTSIFAINTATGGTVMVSFDSRSYPENPCKTLKAEAFPRFP
jgi:hypothetical protein